MHERSVGRVPVLSRVGPVYKKEKERISVCVCMRERTREKGQVDSELDGAEEARLWMERSTGYVANDQTCFL